MTDTVLEPNTPAAADPAAAGAPPPADPPAADPKPAAAAGDPPADPAAPGTLLDGGEGDANPEAPPSDWPSDWKQRLAGDDEKLQKFVNRFSSPKSLLDKVLNQEKLISSGAYKKAMPGEGAKPEEIAEWRKQNDIPESHDKYDLKLEDGLVVGENDKASLDAVLHVAHAQGAARQSG